MLHKKQYRLDQGSNSEIIMLFMRANNLIKFMVKTLGGGSGYYFVKKNCTYRFKVEPRVWSDIPINTCVCV